MIVCYIMDAEKGDPTSRYQQPTYHEEAIKRVHKVREITGRKRRKRPHILFDDAIEQTIKDGGCHQPSTEPHHMPSTTEHRQLTALHMADHRIQPKRTR